MIIRTGDIARGLLDEARKQANNDADPNVYDYMIRNGAVLIRRESKECLYIKTAGVKAGYAIALQGMPGEFTKNREKLDEMFLEMEVVNWEEVEEMIKWAPMVPQL